MFGKNEPKESVSLPSGDAHPIVRRFEHEKKDAFEQEWDIFKTRFDAFMGLKEGASKTEVRRALIRLKRAAMDLRDVLKELGQFKI